MAVIICIILFILFCVMSFFYMRVKGKVMAYKTGIWLAIGKAQRGEPFEQIYGAMECYMPEEDKKQFRQNFKKNLSKTDEKIVEKVEQENPFKLYYIDDNSGTQGQRLKAINVSNQVKEILDKLIQGIVDLEITSEYDNLLPAAADCVREYHNERVGLSDTLSRECMVQYFKDTLSNTFDSVDYEMMGNDLYQLL